MALESPQVVRHDIMTLAHQGLGVREFSLAAARAVRRTVPFDGVCVLTMDPATLLPTGEIVENGLPADAMARMAELEIAHPDFVKFTELATTKLPAATLSGATRGELDRSARHRELKAPNGFGDELRAVLVGDSGTWGGVTLLRERGRPHFTANEIAAMASLSGALLEGLRRALLLSEPSPSTRGDTGMLLLVDDDTIDAVDDAAQAWLSELGEPGLPRVITTVAARARRLAAGDGAEIGPASARFRTPAGRWLLARGSRLGTRTAVVLEPLGPHLLAPLVSEAFGLTRRERAITTLVARGLSTDAVGARLHVSPYTVQDHLKAIFEKVDVNTRGELVWRVFLEQLASAN